MSRVHHERSQGGDGVAGDHDVNESIVRRVAAWVLMPIVASFGPSPGESGQARQIAPVGYVLAVRGEWRVKTSPPQRIAAGRALGAADTIVAGPAPWEDRQITIVWRDGTAVTHVCAEPASLASTRNGWECTKPIPGHAPASESVFHRIVEAVMDHFGGHPVRPTSLLSRGDELAPDGAVTDAVLLVRNGELDVAPAFARVEAGDYDLTFLEIQLNSTGAVPHGTPVHVSYAWTPGTPSTLRAEVMRPGLYELRVQDAQAWILVCGTETWEQARLEYQRAASLAEAWGRAVSPQDARSFLRATLGLLALSHSRNR
jgi:hypothetical protein